LKIQNEKMKNRILPFTYDRSFRIINWGYSFDSLTELKYAVSIMEDYEFLREPVSIYYHPATKITVEHVQHFHRRYTPDFLIRHRQTLEAFLVEVKPRSFQFHPQLRLRQRVAENFISRENLDWKFKIVYDDEIILTSDQLEQFEQCLELNSRSAWKTWFDEYSRRLSRINPCCSINSSENKRIQFLMFGNIDAHRPSKW
jgi:hypothetical protein